MPNQSAIGDTGNDPAKTFPGDTSQALRDGLPQRVGVRRLDSDAAPRRAPSGSQDADANTQGSGSEIALADGVPSVRLQQPQAETETRKIYLDDKDETIFALVDEVDYQWCLQWRWHWRFDRTKQKRYATRGTWRSGRRVTVYMHKEICERKSPQPDEEHHIGDHGDGESLNNRRDNLSWATKSMNRRNRSR